MSPEILTERRMDTATRTWVFEDTEADVDDGRRSRADDWYTIKGKPWKCGSCGASSPYMAEDEMPHRIIVWPTATDPNLLRTIQAINEEDGESASVVPYEESMGPCVSHYEVSPS